MASNLVVQYVEDGEIKTPGYEEPGQPQPSDYDRLGCLEAWKTARDVRQEGRTTTVGFDTIRAMAEHIQRLEDNIAVLTSGRAQLRSQKNKDAITALEQATNGLSPVIRDLWQLVPAQRRPRQEGALTAQKAFDVAELHESILSFLSAWDLLKAYQVNKQWQASVDGSAVLRRDVLAISPEHNSILYLPFGTDLNEEDSDNRKIFTFRGLRSQVWGPWTMSEPIQMTLEDGSDYLSIDRREHIHFTIRPSTFSPGMRCRSMLLCQPPINLLEITAHPEPGFVDDNEPGIDRGVVWKLTRDNGVTVGDFYDAARDYIAQVGHCDTYCCPGDHVHANAIVRLSDRDPRMVARRVTGEEWQRRKEERRAERVARGEPDESSGSGGNSPA